MRIITYRRLWMTLCMLCALVIIYQFALLITISTVAQDSTNEPIQIIQSSPKQIIMDWINETWDNAEQKQSGLEAQYQHLRRYEVSARVDEMFSHYDANWPCLWGETVIGSSGDGLKWGCGVELLNLTKKTQECIVYSLGSNNDWSFEEGIFELVPHCKIFTFDPTIKTAHIPERIANQVEFRKWGLSGDDKEATHYYLLSTIMRKLGHSHIDILKVDIEGFEWN
eukprot:741476_1